MPPTSSFTCTPAGTPAFNSTSFRVAVLKPVRVTVTMYLPAASCGMVNCPSALVTASDVSPVSAFFTTTFAPGMIAPDVSVTVPESVEVARPWADAAVVPRATAANAMKARENSLRAELVMELLLVSYKPDMNGNPQRGGNRAHQTRGDAAAHLIRAPPPVTGIQRVLREEVTAYRVEASSFSDEYRTAGQPALRLR